MTPPHRHQAGPTTTRTASPTGRPRSSGGRRALATLTVGAVTALVGCRAQPDTPSAAPSVTPPASVPVDRLAPGELPPSQQDLFGLPLPRGMKIDAIFRDTGHASGDLSREEVSNYIRTQVHVTHVELGTARTVFPRVRIPGQPAEQAFRIEVAGRGRQTSLVVTRLATRKPRPPISEAEAWRRAGFHADGTPIDPDNVP
jgi:hypothetical protein